MLITKLQLLMKALYLEATLPSLKSAAQHYSMPQLFGFGGSFQPCVAYSKLCEGNLFKETTQKASQKSINLITKI